jgi:hypothetical protein
MTEYNCALLQALVVGTRQWMWLMSSCITRRIISARVNKSGPWPTCSWGLLSM